MNQSVEEQIQIYKEKIKKEKGREPTVDEMYEDIDDNKINKLCDSISKWKTEISQISAWKKR